MTDDRAELFTSLRASTVALLGYDAEHLTAAQRIRVDRAIALRLVIDEAQAKQMRGEVIDIDEFVSASESLERMVGGQPDAPTSRFDGKARERLRQLIERTVMAGEVDVAECMADIREREEMAAIVAAAPDGWKPASGDARRDSDVPHPSS
jgi:hypothetical protein